MRPMAAIAGATAWWLPACLGVALAGPTASNAGVRLAEAARRQVGVTVSYSPGYASLRYPGGDVPINTGVCTDVVIRALRTQGFDLQRLVHEDMVAHFRAYPRRWGLKRPDPSIDHRRVANLAVYLRRRRMARPITQVAPDYRAGDIVTWQLPTGQDHIGLVSAALVPGTQRPKVVHNIGAGAQCEDVLFAYRITGHFRWFR